MDKHKESIIEIHWGQTQCFSTKRIKRLVTREGIGVRPRDGKYGRRAKR